jgi:putative ABC transport system permease protein
VTPPRLATWLLSRRLDPAEREFAIGDVIEEFADRVERDGLARARRWYWRHALRSLFTRRPRRYVQQQDQPEIRQTPMTHLLPDIRFALRLLRRSPGFTAVVIITLALGLGATTGIFSIVHAALLKPLPFTDPDRLVVPRNGTSAADAVGLSYQHLREWRDSGTFEQFAGYFSWSTTLGGDVEAEQLRGMRSSASLFHLLGVQPIVGRLFTPEEEPRTAEFVVLISEPLWRRRFNADPQIQGRRIKLNDVMATVIGVLPGWFKSVRPTEGRRDLFAPLRLTDGNAPPSLWFLSTLARLKPGDRADIAQQQLQAALLRANPDAQPQPRVVVLPFRDVLVRNSRGVLIALMSAVAFLLLITCANLANLLLSRAVARRREIAVRLAIGAARGRIVTQLLTESIVLSGAGGLAGVLVAWMMVRAAANLPALAEAGIYDVTPNWTMFAFAAALSAGAGIFFGLVPALRAGRASMTGDLRDGTRVAGGERLRSTFVVAEVALTLMLLAGAALLGRSLAALVSVDKGFAGESVLTFGLSTTRAKYPTPADETRFFEQVVDRLGRVPGVETAALGSELPFSGSDTNGGVLIEGRPFPPGQNPMAQKRIISPGYFRALGVPVLEGRVFTPADDSRAEGVTVVSQSFARRWFPNGDALGRRIGFNWDWDGFQKIIGVVGDVKHNGLDDGPSQAVYVNFQQRTDSAFTVAVKTAVPPDAVLGAIRSELKALDPERPLTNVLTMDAMLSASIGARRLSLSLVGGFALIGLLLAITGIYGVVSHATQQRSREFGIRLALGAESSSVLALVLRHGVVLAGLGLVIGLAGTLALGGLIRAQLFGVEPTDPLTLGGVCAVLVVIALVASLVPARRAIRINPATVLRAD